MASLFNRAAAKTLPVSDQLANASAALRDRAAGAAAAAESYHSLAEDAAIKNSVATKQATAVEQALRIVTDAGVTL